MHTQHMTSIQATVSVYLYSHQINTLNIHLLRFLLSITERGGNRRPRLGYKHSPVLSLLVYVSSSNKLRVYQTLVLVAPHHKVKEPGNEAGRDVVSLSMFCPNGQIISGGGGGGILLLYEWQITVTSYNATYQCACHTRQF